MVKYHIHRLKGQQINVLIQVGAVYYFTLLKLGKFRKFFRNVQNKTQGTR